MNDTSVSLVETPAAPFTMSAADKAVSLRSLKDAGVGDMIVLTKQNGYVGLYSVKDRSTKMGRHGHTAITLVNHVTGREWAFQLTTELPDPRIALVRRVSKGINSSKGYGSGAHGDREHQGRVRPRVCWRGCGTFAYAVSKTRTQRKRLLDGSLLSL